MDGRIKVIFQKRAACRSNTQLSLYLQAKLRLKTSKRSIRDNMPKRLCLRRAKSLCGLTHRHPNLLELPEFTRMSRVRPPTYENMSHAPDPWVIPFRLCSALFFVAASAKQAPNYASEVDQHAQARLQVREGLPREPRSGSPDPRYPGGRQ